MLAVLVALALTAPPAGGGAPPPTTASEEENTVSELVVIARRHAPDPSDVATECVWRELPPAEREALSREVGRTVASLGKGRPHRPSASVVTEAGVASALRACGAPAQEESLPFAKTAVRFYALERAMGDALAARGLGDAKLTGAWNALDEADREALAAQAGRLAQGSEEKPEATAKVVFGLIRRLRPVGAFNLLGYRAGSVNHLIVAHYAPRAVRHAMEKRF